MAEAAVSSFVASTSAATVMGISAAKTAMALEATTTTNFMEWVPVNITNQISTMVRERFGAGFAVATTVGAEVVERWVMAEVAARKKFMELFLHGKLALGDLEIVVDTGLMDIGMLFTVIRVKVRLRPPGSCAKLIIIVLRARSVLQVRMRTIAILEARATTLMNRGAVSLEEAVV
jgi:hypothetical protein